MTAKHHVNTKLNRMEQMEELIPVNGARPGNAPESAAAKMDAFNDRWIYRMTVGVLGAVMLIGCIGAIILQSNDKEVPDMLLSLGSGAVGALAGLIAPSLTSNS